MAFPKKYAEWAARLRVPAGFAAAALLLVLARPGRSSLALGGALALLGLALRAWAAGHLRKNERLTASGPYAYVRNPLYLGSLIAAAGCAVAGASWMAGAAAAIFFAGFYLPVVEEEESHLEKILPGYRAYREQVPRLRPRLPPYRASSERFSASLYLKNREYQALAAFALVMALLAAKMGW